MEFGAQPRDKPSPNSNVSDLFSTQRNLPVYREHLWSQEGIGLSAPLQPEQDSTVWIHILQLHTHTHTPDHKSIQENDQIIVINKEKRVESSSH